MSQRVDLVGCGRWGRNILRDLLRLGCDVHVYDPDAGACELALAQGAAGRARRLRDMMGAGGAE